MLSFAFKTYQPTQKKIGSLSAFVAFIMLLFTTACTSNQTISNAAPNTSKAVSSNTTTLRFGFISSSGGQAPTGPAGWAIKKGILKPELQKIGISEIRLVNFPNGPDLNEALVSGALDIGIYGDAPALVARSRGIETRLIGQEQVGMNVWLVAKKNGPRSIAELKGQKVATSKGSYMHRYLLGLLQESGLSKTVKVVHLLPRDAQAALERGDIAAYAAPVGAGPLLVSKGFAVIDEAAKHSNLSGTSLTVATETFLTKHPDFPQKWNQAIAESIEDLKANPQEYYKFHAEVSKYPLEIVKASYPLEQFPIEPFPVKGLELLEGTKNFLVTQKLAQSDFKLNDWVLNEQQRSHK